ncbi:hypothetical protein [Ramlibacter sp.]|uniref:hypothetical protein n=1 Tax=Ramlibacter sp. TaxID=1917967 RepID=UPI003D0AE10A
MPESTAIYRKTARGQQAIATRDAAIPPRARSLLIVVDGRKSAEELHKFALALGDEKSLAFLEDNGYVEQVGANAPSPAAGASPLPPPAPPATSVAPPSSPVVPLREAQRFAVRRLIDALGPGAETVCMKIESARNAADFGAAIEQAQRLMRGFKGDAAADEFLRELETRRPG